MEIPVWKEIRQNAKDQGVQMFADISGIRAWNTAKELDLNGIKIHSSNFFNRDLIRKAFDIAPIVFVSLGGIHPAEIVQMVEEIDSWGMRERLGLMYGFQSEPTPLEKSNLNRLRLLMNLYPIKNYDN